MNLTIYVNILYTVFTHNIIYKKEKKTLILFYCTRPKATDFDNRQI